MLDSLADGFLDALGGGERVGPVALLFLLRRLSTGARPDAADPLGAALARELAEQRPEHADDHPAWITLFSEAATLSDDPRLVPAATALLERARCGWTSSAGDGVDRVMRSIEACLVAVNLAEARRLAPEAIDALEHVIAGAYRPGVGMSRQVGVPFVAGGTADQARSASALLTAYMLTARLPYAMLADELMQRVVRTGLDRPGLPSALRSDIARVFCRLAALHRDDDYRQAAVLSADTDYALAATQTLTALAPSMREHRVEAAHFGLALADWLDLQ